MQVFTKLAVALGIAAFVFVIVIVVVWCDLGGEMRLCNRQFMTWLQVHDLANRLKSYVGEHRRPPARLGELAAADEPQVEDGDFLDAWGQRIKFQPAGDGFVVVSFGRDGVPGGSGPDADLYSDNRSFDARLPSLRQFLTDEDYNETAINGFILDGILTAAIVACTVFMGLLAQTKDQPMKRGGIVAIVVVAVLAVAAGIVLLPLHIPSGH